MNIKGIIFDLDGTLVDTIEDISDSMNRVLVEFNKDEYTYEEYKKMIGGGFKKLVERAYGEKDGKVLKRLEEVYSKNYLNKSKPYDGILELLEILQGEEIKLAINTNKNHEYSIEMAKTLFPNIEFTKIIGTSKNIPTKPDTTGVNIILDNMKLNKNEVLFIGDSNVDILTGKNASIKTVGVDWGFRGEDELKEYGANFIVYDPFEILELI